MACDYTAAHGVDVWVVGGTYEWDRGSGDGYGSGARPLDAGPGSSFKED